MSIKYYNNKKDHIRFRKFVIVFGILIFTRIIEFLQPEHNVAHVIYLPMR